MWIPRCPLLIIIGRKAWCHLHCKLRKSCEKSNVKKSLKNHHSSKPTAKSLLVNSLKEDLCNIRYEKCITKQCRVSSRWLTHNVYSNIPIFSYTLSYLWHFATRSFDLIVREYCLDFACESPSCQLIRVKGCDSTGSWLFKFSPARERRFLWISGKRQWQMPRHGICHDWHSCHLFLGSGKIVKKIAFPV